MMIKVLPIISTHKNFALKGGTALNFFILDMPRLSVDIDLMFLPILNREDTLKEISKSLDTIANQITEAYGYGVLKTYLKETTHIIKLIVKSPLAHVKIEPNIIIRGSVFPVETKPLSEKVSTLFQQNLTMQVLNKADLYGGKICAALDRQHPRDLFDILMLFENGGITESIRKAFLAYLVSHPRPISELLNPNLKSIKSIYENSFEGMSLENQNLEALIKTRTKLITTISQSLTKTEKTFLLSLANGSPDFSSVELGHIKKYPAIIWKQQNINRMSDHKRQIEIEKLSQLFMLPPNP